MGTKITIAQVSRLIWALQQIKIGNLVHTAKILSLIGKFVSQKEFVVTTSPFSPLERQQIQHV